MLGEYELNKTKNEKNRNIRNQKIKKENLVPDGKSNILNRCAKRPYVTSSLVLIVTNQY